MKFTPPNDMSTTDARMPSRLPRLFIPTLATLFLVAGYADLWRGGITVAPLLLVVAYCVLIPWACAQLRFGAVNARQGRGVTARPTASSTPNDYHPSYRYAVGVGVFILVLYLLTLAPTTAMWDTSEYITAAYTMGIPHPPGNPLFVLIGRAFSLLPIAPTVALRINLLAAISSAAASALWFLITERIAATWIPDAWRRRVVAALAALIGATAFTVWNQSVVNEKVYTVSLAGLTLVAWLGIRWIDARESPRGPVLLVLIAYFSGLGYANHMAGLLAAPAVALTVALLQPRSLVRPALLAACSVALLVGMSPFATQPIRAAHHPAINEGEVSACRENLAVSCTLSRETYKAFTYNFNREQYGKPSLDQRQAPFSAQIGMWWLYFQWQWFRDAHGEHPQLQMALATTLLLLGSLGGVTHFRRDRDSFWLIGTLIATLSVVLIFYLNFKYGASQAPELGDNVPREVRDRDYFFIWSFSSWGVWSALGLATLWEWGAQAMRTSLGSRRWLATAPMLALAVVPLATNWSSASRARDTATADFAHDLLNSVEPYGVLITYGDNDTFPLWYAQEVEGIRRDVTVGVLSLMNTDWFVRGLIRRPIYEYDAAHGPAIYRDKQWTKPNAPPLAMTFAQADSLPDWAPVREPARFEKNGLVAIVDPKKLPQDGAGNGILMRADLVVFRMIADSWPTRPIYISRTTGNYADQLGLMPYAVGHGLARKLMLPDTAKSSGAVLVEGSGWFDTTSSQALWRDVFKAPRAFVRRGDWIDRPSVSIPYSYLIAGSELGEVLRARGDTLAAATVLDSVGQIARAVRLGS